jgi:hypothetical protein
MKASAMGVQMKRLMLVDVLAELPPCWDGERPKGKEWQKPC